MERAFYEHWSDDNGYMYFRKNVCDKGASVRLHIHNAVELKFIVGGKYLLNIGGEERVFESSGMVFVNSRRTHMYKTIEPTINYVLVIDHEIFRAVCPKGKVLPVFTEKNENIDEIIQFLDDISSKWVYLDKKERRGVVFRILGMVLQYCPLVDDVYDKKEDIVAQVLEYIEDHHAEELSLNSLASEFGYTKNYFSNIFNKTIGMNLRECVNRCRISKAIKIIKENPKIPLWSVAEKVGYESFNTFSRVYKKYSQEEFGDKS